MAETEHSESWRESKIMLLVVVTIAMFIDLVLVSTVVPVIPRYLYEIRHPNYADIAAQPPAPQNVSSGNVSTSNQLVALLNATNTAHLGNDTQGPIDNAQPPAGQNASSGNVSTLNQQVAPLNATNTTHLGNDTNYSNLNITHKKLNVSNETSSDGTSKNISHSQIEAHDNMQDSAEVGILFGSKPFVQLFINPIVGPLTQKIGYSKLMFAGFIILFFSTLLFALGRTYEVLFFARAFQGVGSSCTAVAGMSALASRYTRQKERDNAIRIAFGGAALGVMCGPPFGGFMYEYFGKMSPFFVICGLTLIDGVLQLLMKKPKKIEAEKKVKPPSLWALMKDPYICIIAVGMFLTCGVFALFETSLPLWMLDTMKPTKSELGTVFIPTVVGFILVLNVVGKWLLKLTRWRLAMFGMSLTAVSLFSIPFTTNITQLLTPNLGLGLGLGMVQTALMPEFAHIVDIRHTSVYGNVFAICDFSQCLGQAIGPILGGLILKHIGFKWLILGATGITVIYTPFIYLLKDPPRRNNKTQEDEKLSMKLINNGIVQDQK